MARHFPQIDSRQAFYFPIFSMKGKPQSNAFCSLFCSHDADDECKADEWSLKAAFFVLWKR